MKNLRVIARSKTTKQSSCASWFASLALAMTVLFMMAGCGDSETSSDEDGGPTITIASGHIFATPTVTALSAATVIIINNSSDPHTVTSQSAADAFDDSGDFDVTVPSNGRIIFTLPEADVGDVFNFYCSIHTNAMTPSSGTITIE